MNRFNRVVYNAHLGLRSAIAHRTFRESFDQVKAFCLFVGYPRSGHSLIGAMLNAHRHAVIAHELTAPKLIQKGCTRASLYAYILGKASHFHWHKNRGFYDYRIPGSHQGEFETLKVIGDKRGGHASRHIAGHPDFLARLGALVEVPVKLVHVIRNPYDNIATIGHREHRTLDDSIRYYFDHVATTQRLTTDLTGEQIITIHHEALVADPKCELTRLCRWFDLDADSEYLKACGSIVYDRPHQSRHNAAWSRDHRREVVERSRDVPFLSHYHFDQADQ